MPDDEPGLGRHVKMVIAAKQIVTYRNYVVKCTSCGKENNNKGK
jgi:hypothetical protein